LLFLLFLQEIISDWSLLLRRHPEFLRLGERQNSEMTPCSGHHRQINDINAAISSERALENSVIIDIRNDQLLK